MRVDDELLGVFKAEVEAQLGRLAETLDAPRHEWDLVQLFRLAHNVKGAAHMVDAVVIHAASHALEDLFASLRRGTPANDEAVRLARDGAELLEAAFVDLEKSDTTAAEAFHDEVNAFLAVNDPTRADSAATEAKNETPDDAADDAKPDAEVAPKPPRKTARRKATPREPAAPAPPVEPVESAEPPDAAEEGVPPPALEAPEDVPQEAAATLRVGADKVDKLMGLTAEFVTAVDRSGDHAALVSELRIAFANLERQMPEVRDIPGYAELAQVGAQLHRAVIEGHRQQEKLSAALQDAIRGLRMVGVGSLHQLLAKLVRDTARLTHKRASFRIVGGDTEIDRGLLEELRDPLVHLIRNAVDHGLEPPDDRRALGKPVRGRIELHARSAGSKVELALSDDGAGIDPERLRQHAAERGLLTPERAEQLSVDECYELLFLPGFSTAAQVSKISGRGVGLDVVRDNIVRLGGSVRVRSSPRQGTSFLLHLPLTRLTTKAVVVRLGGHPLLIPISDVERTFHVDRSSIRSADGQDVVEVDGMLLPVRDLEPHLGLRTAEWEERPGVILSRESKRCAFLVDEVEGEKEVIIQSLSWNLTRVPGVSGCTVLAGERVAPILDAGDLLGTGRLVTESLGRAIAGPVRQRRVLVVDDSVTSRTLEKNILTSAGYDVTTATNGAEAWETLRENTFDLMLSDVDMPEMNGLELCSKVRDDERLGEMPVILVTSLGNEEHKQRGAEAGANAYIVKGAFDQDELLRAMARLL